MKQLFLLLTIAGLFGLWTGPAWSRNPFTARPETLQKAPEPPFKSRLFVKIIVWQHQLKQRMSDLIRRSRNGGDTRTVLLLMALALAYGAVHAAGPGHGKVVAMSYVLSHRSSLTGGLLFGLCIAGVHALSGIVGVLGLHFIIRRSVSDTLASVTLVTQGVSFALITLLGLGLFMKHGLALLRRQRPAERVASAAKGSAGLLPWAMAVGLVPCPAVVMVMLFCMSMEAIRLGFLLAACMAIGMAGTLSVAVLAVIMGKAGVMNALPHQGAKTVERYVGVLSGGVIAFFGGIFLFTSVYPLLY